MKKFYFLLSLALPMVAIVAAVAVAEAPARVEPSRVVGTGAFFAASVADIDASSRWYSEKLGLTVTMRTPKTDGNTVAILEGEGLIVELIQRDGSKVAAEKDRLLVHGLFKAGVIVKDFDATLAMLRARGAEIAFGPFPAREGQRANFAVRDNDGNLIQFFGR